jgi:putative transposase
MLKPLGHGQHDRSSPQRWQILVRNHAQAIVAYDFCVVVTASFRCLYVFIVIDHAARRSLHAHVTAHLVAQWTLQQLREAIPTDHAYRFLIHDGDSIFSAQLDQHICTLGATSAAPPTEASSQRDM